MDHLNDHPLFWSVSAGVLVLGASLGWGVFRRWSGRPTELRLLGALAPLAALVALQILVGLAFVVANKEWSPARFAQSAALVRGYDLYAPLESGPLLSTIYGPVSVLLFAPAAFLDDITWALITAYAINCLCMIAPLAFFLTRSARKENRGLAWALFAFLPLTLTVFESTKQMIGSIHVDGPAVGLGILSCAFLIGRERLGRRELWPAAFVALLAAWTKQVEAPMVFGQLLWLGLRHGRKTVLAYFSALAFFGIAVSGVFVAIFGFEPIFLNTLKIPGAHGFYPFRPILKEAARMVLPLLILLSGITWFGRGTQYGGAAGHSNPLRSDWGLALLVFLFLLPTSILARAKHGGFLGSYHSQYYLIAASGLALSQLAASVRPGLWRGWVCPAAGLAALTLSVYQPYRHAAAAAPFIRCINGYTQMAHPSRNRQRQVQDFALAHPEQAYFPWHPLASLYAEGKLYHFEWAVYDRQKSGVGPSQEHIRANLPAKLRYVLYPRKLVQTRPPPKMIVLPYLEEFDQEVRLDSMPEWMVFMRPEDARADGHPVDSD